MKDTHKISTNKNYYLLSALIIISLLLGSGFVFYYYQMQVGPEQPIPFSHRVHAQNKDISCFFCHEGAMKTARAGVPPMETCMLCHDRIIIHHPEIEKLRKAYENNEPILWEKVEDVPDFVFFNHSVHINKQIDCSECHGNVENMDRIETANKFTMGFCVDCHQQMNATTDCFTCHR